MAFEFAARKFSRAKWVKPSFIKDDDIPADAITLCLKTADNKLSLWDCTEQKLSIEDVVLALATGLKVDKLEKMHVIAFQKDELHAAGLTLVSSDGETQVVDMVDRHMDLVELTLSKLANLAKIMANQIDTERHCHSFTRKEVAKILNDSIVAGRITIDKLGPGIQAEIAKLSKRN